MSYRKSLLVFAFAALAFTFVPHANARSLFRDSGIPSDSNNGGSLVGYKYEGCFDGQNAAFSTNGAITLDCQQLGPNQEPAGSCGDGIPAIKYEGDVAFSKGNKNTPSRITRLDGQGFQTTQGNKTTGWPDTPFDFVVGGAKNSKNNRVFTAVGYEDFTDAAGNTIAKATLVISTATPVASGGTDTLAMAATAAKLTFGGLVLGTDAELCARLFDEGDPPTPFSPAQEGIAVATGFFDGSLRCTVDNDTWVTPCLVQALVTQAHSGRFSMQDNNFEACEDEHGDPVTDGTCGQVWHQPNVNLNKGFIKNNFPATEKLCQGCVFSAAFKGGTGLTDVGLRACISRLGAIPANSANDHTVNINCDFSRTGDPVALEEIPVNADNNINPASTNSKMSVNFDNTASVLTQLLEPTSVVFVMTNGVNTRTVANDGAPTFNGQSAVFRTFVIDMVNCWADLNPGGLVDGKVASGQVINFRAEGFFSDGAGGTLDSGVFGLAVTSTTGQDFTPMAVQNINGICSTMP
jgi:hypothetical protein